MAVLRRNTTPMTDEPGDYLTDLPPDEYAAVCTDVLERDNVERQKYQSDEMECVDLIAFEFSVTGRSGETRRVRSREMRVSSHEMSALYAFLKEWSGGEPEDGLDTDTLMGCAARLTLQHSRGKKDPSKTYVRITAIAPDAEQGEARK